MLMVPKWVAHPESRHVVLGWGPPMVSSPPGQLGEGGSSALSQHQHMVSV